MVLTLNSIFPNMYYSNVRRLILKLDSFPVFLHNLIRESSSEIKQKTNNYNEKFKFIFKPLFQITSGQQLLKRKYSFNIGKNLSLVFIC